MTYDLVVVGAGPAGLAAATAAAARGATVALLDAGERPGGQYFRHRRGDDGAQHHRWRAFTRLRDRLADVDYLPRHQVWTIEAGARFTVHAVAGIREPRATRVVGTTVILATGAYDRSVPFPGWDLPGVLTAGGAQSLLKGSGVVAGNRIVVGGTGPFLLPVATGLAAAGATVHGVYEANRPRRDVLGLATDTGKLLEGAGYAARFARHRIRYATGRAVVAAHGTDRLTAVTVARLTEDWQIVADSARRIECDVLAVGYGFSPQLELAQALGCRLTPGADGMPVVAVSATQRTTVPGVYAAGELTGVGGAALSLVEGQLAGHAVTGTRPAGRLLTRRAALRRSAERLARVYPVADGWKTWLDPDTTVCRCEEVDKATVDRAVSDGGVDARTVKLLSRAGMGYCQGRMCGFAVNRLSGQPLDASPVSRPIAHPIRLGDLAEEGDNS